MHYDFQGKIRLKDIVLTVRTSKVLNKLGFQTIGEVMLTSGSSLLSEKNFGRRSLNELKGIVTSLCLTGVPVAVDSDADVEPIDYESYDSMVESFVRQCIKNVRNQDLFLKRFCFREGKSPILEELGEYFGITRERARQILKKGFIKLQIKANVDKLNVFSEQLSTIISQGGGLIELGSLAFALQKSFDWPTPPYSLALGQFLLLWYPEENFKNDSDVISVETECLSCDRPLQIIRKLDFEGSESYHVQVISKKISEYCTNNCSQQIITSFHRAFIEQLIQKSDAQFVLHDDVVLPYDKWKLRYCDNLEEAACYALEGYGKPMHFTEIAKAIRNLNGNFNEIGDRHVHNAIMRYDSIEIINRGTYGLKSWGVGGYRSVSTAIEQLIDDNGLPMRRINIIKQLQGEFTEGNITAALTADSRFTSLGDGLYDRPETWKDRSIQSLLALLPESVATFTSYLISRNNNTSYKLVMGYIFIRSMDEAGSIYVSKLKDMFYNFYRSRSKKGWVVEDDSSAMSRITEFSPTEIKNRVCPKPLDSFLKSGFFHSYSQQGIRIKIPKNLYIELQQGETRDSVLITILKAIDEYFSTINPVSIPIVTNINQQKSEPNQELQKEKSVLDAENQPSSITIRSKRRGKIRL
ncbi:DNA-directed RNA polymerase subunit alpha C-terminal domain-containing protein [Desulforhopalus sp. 52FAK]